MGLTNPGRTLGRFSLLSISLKLLTLSGIPPFFINSFRLASLLALLVGLNLSSMIGALVWFFKIGKAVPFESVEVFRKNPFLALYFSLFINDLSASMPSSVSCSLYADDLAIWSSSPSVPTAVEAIQRALFRLECWSEYWCLPLNPSKCEASFFSVGPHQANLQPNLLLLGSRLRFNPTPTFLGVTFDRTLFFTEHVSSLKAKFFPRLKALRCISASSCGPSKESLSVLYKSFLRPLLTYASPGWFLFLSATNLTKLERLHRAASRAITGCLSSSPIPLLLTEASLPPLRVTLTHFTLFSYERALCLPTFFPISGLARLGVKPRLCRSSWRALASTHPLMLPFTCSREAFLAFPPCPPWNLLLFTVEFTLPTPCSRSDPPLSRQGAALAHLDSLPHHDLVLWTDGSVPFPFGKGGSGVLEACAILHALCWSQQHQQLCHFSSLLLLSDSRSVLATLSSPHLFSYLKLCGRSGRKCLLSPPVLSGYNWFPDTRFYRGTTRLTSLQDGERYLRRPQPFVVSLLLSLVSTLVFSRTGGVLSLPNILTHRFPQFPLRNLCSLVMLAVLSRLRCNGHSLLLGSYLSRIGRIENPSCSACGHSSQDTSHLILHCPATDSASLTLWRLSVSVRPLVQTLGSCPASGARWSSAMPPSLGRGRVTNNNNNKATFSEKLMVLKLPLKDLKNLPELESLLEKADVRDNLVSDVLNYF